MHAKIYPEQWLTYLTKRKTQNSIPSKQSQTLSEKRRNTGKLYTPNAHVHDHYLPRLGSVTIIKSAGAKLV